MRSLLYMCSKDNATKKNKLPVRLIDKRRSLLIYSVPTTLFTGDAINDVAESNA